MPTLKELRERDQINLNEKKQISAIEEKTEEPKSNVKKSLSELRQRDEISLNQQKAKEPEKKFSQSIEDTESFDPATAVKNLFFNPEESQPEQVFRGQAKAAGEGASGGLDFILKGFGNNADKEDQGSFKELYQNQLGYNSEQESPAEQFTSNFTQNAVGGLPLPGGRNFNQQRLSTDALFSGGYVGGKQMGLDELGSAGTGLGASTLPAILNAARNPQQAVQGARQGVVDLITSFGKGFKTNAPQIEAAAGRQNINVPATEVLENPLLERVSQTVARKKGVGDVWANNIDQQYSQAVNRTFRANPILRQASRETSGAQAAENVDQVFKVADRDINKQYDIAKKADPTFKTTPQPLASVIDDLRSSLPPVTPETQSLHSKFARVENEIYETVQKAKFNPKTQLIEMVPVRQVREMGLEELMNLRAQLGDLSRTVDMLTGTRTLQKRLRPALNESLQELESTNKPLYDRITKLDQEKYVLREEEYGLKVMDKLRKADRQGKTGEEAFKMVRNPEEYRAMASQLKKTPQGRQILNEFNQSKAEEIFKKTISEAQLSQFNQESLLKMLNDPMKATWLNEVMSPTMRQNVQDLQTLSSHLINGSAKLKAIAGASKNSTDVVSASQLGAALGHLLNGDPVGMVLSVGGAIAPKMLARAFIDPRFQQDLINAARAAQNNQMNSFGRFMQSALDRARNATVTSTVNVENEKAQEE